ncbi:MAG TPA: DNA cytosine methyltransferase [Ignavibacteriaceae bacterium]|nr:DNA cytosine methyltransferase [Ignavibacteriaceae bacterium]
MNKHQEHKIPILSFYSGGGLMDMGFEKAGFEIIWTNEFDEDFIKLHEAGITSWRKARGNGVKAEIFNKKSITEIKAIDIINEAFPNGKPECFGIIGGPPCQDFSMNGNLKGFDGDRGKLTEVFLDKILSLMPTFFVMENVTGLVKRKQTLDYLNELLKNVRSKYCIDYKMLNALDFGVPQFRERVFFIGIRKDKLNDEIGCRSKKWFEYLENRNYQDSAKNYDWPKAIKFGHKKINKPQDIPIELCVYNCLIGKEDINKIPNANEHFKLYVDKKKLINIKEGETNRPSFKRLHRYKYSPTACYGNNEVHLHPWENRRISVREALRIQGVEDNYILPAELSVSKKFKMIGNGVPVPLAEAVAKMLKKILIENKL